MIENGYEDMVRTDNRIVLFLGMLFAVFMLSMVFVSATSITDGLEAYYKLDETTGLTATDFSGNGNDGTMVGYTFNDGLISGGVTIEDGAMAFNGTNGSVDVTDMNLKQYNQKSISWWVKSGTGEFKRIFSDETESNVGNIIIQQRDSTRLQINLGSGVNINTSLGDGDWHFYTLTIDNNTVGGGLLYQDGVSTPIATLNVSDLSSVGSTNLTIGATQYDKTALYDGDLDSVLIHNRILTPTEISVQYSAGRGSYALSGDGLVAQYSGRDYNATHILDTNPVVEGATNNTAQGKRFDGTNTHYINTGINGNTIIGEKDFTFSAWTKATTFVSDTSIISHRGTGIITGLTTRTGNKFALNLYDGSGQLITSSIVNPNQWYHVVGTYKYSTKTGELFVNGISQGNLVTTNYPTSNTNPLGIGNTIRTTTWDYELNGSLDEVGVWSRALSEDEILYLYESSPHAQTQFSSEQVSGTTDQNITLSCTSINGCKAINYNINNEGWNKITVGGTYGEPFAYSLWTAELKTDLKSYYKFDEVSGTAVEDSHNNYDGTASNARIFTSQVEGVINTGADFSQGQDYISVSGVGGGTTESFAYWVNSDDYTTAEQVFGGHLRAGGSGGWNIFNFYIGSNKVRVNLSNTVTHNVYTSTGSLTNGEWYHLFFVVKDNSYVKIYIDGKLDSTHVINYTPPNNRDGLIIGANEVALEQNFTGTIDEMAYWTRELTIEEINQIRISSMTGENVYSFVYSGSGDHNIQFYSTDNANNNETTKLSYFPMFKSENEPNNSRIKLTGVTNYNGYTITSWLYQVNGTPLSGTTDRIKYYNTQSNQDLNVCLTTNNTDTICQSVFTWDTINPIIDANIETSGYGFTNTFDINYNLTCNDNFPFITYKVIWANNGTTIILDEQYLATGTLLQGTLDLNAGQEATLTFTCTDASNNQATYTAPTQYAIQFNIVDETTGLPFDLTKVTHAQAYTYDGNYLFNFKDTNNATQTYWSPTSVIRFDFTYPDEAQTKISREINFDYIDDANVPVCAAEYQQFYLYRFLSTTEKPIILYNDFANCYSLASTTKFLWTTYLTNTAYTINKPYYLYTYSNGVKSLLAILDGANNTEINLDILQFNQAQYQFDVASDSIVFRPGENDSNTIVFYFFSPNNNTWVNLEIYDQANNLLWDYLENTDTNSFQVTFFYGDLDINSDDLLKIVVTVLNDGDTTTFFKYFNTKGEAYAGLLNPIVAIVLSFFVLFFGITMVSYRFAMGWFGIVISFLAIGILALAPLYDYVLFLMAIYFIIGLFIGLIGREQTLGVN